MKNLPITRLNKFISDSDYNFNINIGVEYLHGDINTKVLLYKVDKVNTETSNIYAEAGKNDIKYLPPVEINCLINIDGSVVKTYSNGLNKYNEPGNLTFSVYIKHLNELNIDIDYGDYIGFNETEDKIRYYSVVNDGKIITDNKHSMFGYKPFYRTITCSIVQKNEFNG